MPRKQNPGKDFEELVSIIRKILSKKDGCIKAKQDTLKGALGQLQEELEELKKATEMDDKNEINEELGHVLYDTIYFAMLGEREGKVDLKKVFKELNWSMKFRHPHIFEGTKAETIEEVKRLKKERKDTYHKMKKEGKLTF